MIATLRVTSRAFALGLVFAGVSAAPGVHVAGTAYGVGTAEVNKIGNCKIESWLS